jgi:hypothetical protein
MLEIVVQEVPVETPAVVVVVAVVRDMAELNMFGVIAASHIQMRHTGEIPYLAILVIPGALVQKASPAGQEEIQHYMDLVFRAMQELPMQEYPAAQEIPGPLEVQHRDLVIPFQAGQVVMQEMQEVQEILV